MSGRMWADSRVRLNLDVSALEALEGRGKTCRAVPGRGRNWLGIICQKESFRPSTFIGP